MTAREALVGEGEVAGPLDPAAVRENRAAVAAACGLSAPSLTWMRQVHGADVWYAADGLADPPGPVDAMFTDVPGRVAKALLDLAERFGSPGMLGIQVNHDLTQEELAQLVGASRETVNKALADFAARGWIQLAAKSVLITDVDRLRKRAR